MAISKCSSVLLFLQEKCLKCGGKGSVKAKKSVMVDVPAGELWNQLFLFRQFVLCQTLVLQSL